MPEVGDARPPRPTELVKTDADARAAATPAADRRHVLVDYVGVRSADGEQFDTQLRRRPVPRARSAPAASSRAGTRASSASRTGERLQLDIPADLAYGDQPQGDVIQAGDALTFVIDVHAVVPAADAAPQPTATDLPTSSETVDRGRRSTTWSSAPATTLADAARPASFHLVLARGDDGTVLQSTWADGSRSRCRSPRATCSPASPTAWPGCRSAAGGSSRCPTTRARPDAGDRRRHRRRPARTSS